MVAKSDKERDRNRERRSRERDRETRRCDRDKTRDHKRDKNQVMINIVNQINTYVKIFGQITHSIFNKFALLTCKIYLN